MIVSPNETAFILGKAISNNTLLASEQMYGFGSAHTPRRCRLLVDLRKVYDTLWWDAILKILANGNYIICGDH